MNNINNLDIVFNAFCEDCDTCSPEILTNAGDHYIVTCEYIGICTELYNRIKEDSNDPN